MQTQVEIELEANEEGRTRMAKAIANNEDKGGADNNPYAQAIYRRFVLPLAERIRNDLAVRKAGRRQAHVVLLDGCDPDALAFVAVRQCITTILSGSSENVDKQAGRSVATNVGRSAYGEVLLTQFEDINPELYYHLTTDFKRRLSINERHRMTVFKMQAAKNGIAIPEWSAGDTSQVGAYLTDCLCELGLLEMHRETVFKHGKAKQYFMIRMAPDVVALIEQISNFVVESSPYFLPCVEQPHDWTDVSTGGFHTPQMRRLMPWVIKAHPQARDAVREADLSQELACINALQRVEWRINKRMLDAIGNVSRNFDMKEVLAQAEAPKPQRPDWLTEDMKEDAMDSEQKAEFKRWRREMAEWYTNTKARGVTFGRFFTALRVARKFKDYDKLYFVYFMDFRGRKYVQSTGVSPQGSDLQKSLLEFAVGKPLLTKEAKFWFKANGANRWGQDKLAPAAKEKFIDDNRELILSFAADPVENSGWKDADKPLQFLAWCFEYADWCAWGDKFKSRLSVGLDGSCNGLQNFSAMLRDSVGGVATNLVPSDNPNDIYGLVAERATALLQAAEEDEEGFRSKWLEHGLTRKLVKRSVMTLPYGSTKSSCRDFIQGDYLNDGQFPELDKKLRRKAAQFLSDFVWAAIGDVVVKAREAMKWLQEASRLVLKGGDDRVCWVTPTGFPVVQVYWKQDIHQINTKLHGKTRLKMSTDTTTPDRLRHRNGIAPNFVHSLDASHLTRVVSACAGLGITALHMVHDDFGTHPADTQALYEAIRETFVAQYEAGCPMNALRERYPNLPERPELGDLDIRQVLDSVFFFY